MEDINKNNETVTPASDTEGTTASTEAQTVLQLNTALDELNNKYMRLYADFENYKKRVNKDREELLKYGNEALLYDMLTVIDNLELALKHATADINSGLVQGVEMTLKELLRTLQKFGLTRIEALGKDFDPAVHHAMSQVERDDIEEKKVVEEMRPGYMYHEKVLRPSLVIVSTKPSKQVGTTNNNESSDSDNASDDIEIEIKKEIEED